MERDALSYSTSVSEPDSNLINSFVTHRFSAAKDS